MMLTPVVIDGREWNFARAGMTRATVDLLAAINKIQKTSKDQEESAMLDLLDKLVTVMERSLRKAGYSPEEIEECLDSIPAMITDAALFSSIQSALLGL